LIKAIQQPNKRRKAYGDFLKESLNFKNGTFVPPTDDTCDRCVRDSNPPFLAILYPLSYFVYDKSRIRTYDPSINTTVLLLCQYIVFYGINTILLYRNKRLGQAFELCGFFVHVCAHILISFSLHYNQRTHSA